MYELGFHTIYRKQSSRSRGCMSKPLECALLWKNTKMELTPCREAPMDIGSCFPIILFCKYQLMSSKCVGRYVSVFIYIFFTAPVFLDYSQKYQLSIDQSWSKNALVETGVSPESGHVLYLRSQIISFVRKSSEICSPYWTIREKYFIEVFWEPTLVPRA